VNASVRGNRLILDRYQTASGLRLLWLHSPVPHLALFLFLTIRFTRRLLRLQFSRCRSVWGGYKIIGDGFLYGLEYTDMQCLWSLRGKLDPTAIGLAVISEPSDSGPRNVLYCHSCCGN